jgi:hypothetical protein
LYCDEGFSYWSSLKMNFATTMMILRRTQLWNHEERSLCPQYRTLFQQDPNLNRILQPNRASGIAKLAFGTVKVAFRPARVHELGLPVERCAELLQIPLPQLSFAQLTQLVWFVQWGTFVYFGSAEDTLDVWVKLRCAMRDWCVCACVLVGWRVHVGRLSLLCYSSP